MKEVTHNLTKHGNLTYRPRGIVFQVLSLRLFDGCAVMTTCLDCRIPRIDVSIVLRSDVMGLSIDDEVSNNFGEV
jgi:hypothetical protein